MRGIFSKISFIDPLIAAAVVIVLSFLGCLIFWRKK